MEYPEEIYRTSKGDLLMPEFRKSTSTLGWGRQHAYEVGFQAGRAEKADYIKSISSLESVLTDVEQLEGEDLPFVKSLIERSFRAGISHNLATDPLAGYSNLTEAIKSEKTIDWERLDGLKVKCVNPELRGEIHGALKRNAEANAELSGGWRDRDMDEIYTSALWAGWHGKRGWTLWIEGDIPLIRKTADQLEVGTYFRGRVNNHVDGETMYVGRAAKDAEKIICFAPSMIASQYGAEDWVVLEEYGTFQKPEGE